MKKSTLFKTLSTLFSTALIFGFVSCSAILNPSIDYDGGKSSTKALSAPTNVTATSGSSYYTITWSSVRKASSYNVYRSTSSYSSYATKVGSTSSTTYTDTSASNTTSYYYFITAVSSSGTESDYSDYAYCSSYYTAPSAPTWYSATAYSSYNYLSWYSVTGASSYYVYYSETDDIDDAIDNSQYYTTYNTYYYDYSGTTKKYYYWIKAYANGAYSEPSASKLVTGYSYVDNSFCASSLSVTASATNRYLSWTAASDATYYKIYRGTSSTFSSASLLTSYVTSTYYYDYGASSYNNYYYFVVAANSTTTSDTAVYYYSAKYGSAPSLSSTSSLIATATSSGRTLSWTSVSGASWYKVYRSSSSSFSFDTANYITYTTSTSYVDTTALSSGTYYYFVFAGNYNGNSSNYRYCTSAPYSSSTYGAYSQVPSGATGLSVYSSSTLSTSDRHLINSTSATQYYYFYASSGSTYKVTWADGYNTSSGQTDSSLSGVSNKADIKVSCYLAGASSQTGTYKPFTEIDNGYSTNAKSFTASYTGYYVLEVTTYGSTSQTGYYALRVYQ